MDWAEIDTLLWLFVVLSLIRWAFNSLVSWLGTKSILSDNVTQGILNVTK